MAKDKQTAIAKVDDEPVVRKGPKRWFEVSLQHGPKAVVEAYDEADAFAVYKEQQGVVSSSYQPTIQPCDPPVEPAKADADQK